MSGPLPQLKSLFNSIHAAWIRKKLGHPDRKLQLIAVTGSQGKTTIANLVFAMLRHGKLSVGLISTDGVWANDQLLTRAISANTLTAADFHRTLKQLYLEGIDIVIVETYPDVIREEVFKDIEFAAGTLVNIGGAEFLEGYRDQQEYAEVIFQPITQIVHEGLAVINADDDSAKWIQHRAQYIEQNIYAAWCSKSQAENLQMSLSGMSFRYEGGFFQSALIGGLNLENLLLAIKLANKYVGIDQIDAAVNEFGGIPGRVEAIQVEPFTVIVDYAYQPVIVDRLLKDIESLRNPESRLICVIGAPGQRSQVRRYVGRTVAKYAKTIIMVPLDPRNEEVIDINTDMFEYTEKSNTVMIERFADHDEFRAVDKVNIRNKVERVVRNGDIPVIAFDTSTPQGRADGIALALQLAGPEDVVAIIGKGNDDILDFGKAVYEWSDRKMAKELLRH